jgi:hypothetical protein
MEISFELKGNNTGHDQPVYPTQLNGNTQASTLVAEYSLAARFRFNAGSVTGYCSPGYDHDGSD